MNIKDLAFINDNFNHEQKEEFKSLGLDYIKYIDEKINSTQVMILKKDDLCIISFQGSTIDIRNYTKWKWLNILISIFKSPDWINNFDIEKVDTQYGRISRGIYESIMLTKKDLLNEIINLDPNKIIVTGHSRGGALALMFYLMLCKHGYSSILDISLESFNNQKIMDFKAAKEHKEFEEKATRHYVINDIVSYIPPFFMFGLGFFKHFGIPKKYKTKEKNIEKIHAVRNFY